MSSQNSRHRRRKKSSAVSFSDDDALLSGLASENFAPKARVRKRTNTHSTVPGSTASGSAGPVILEAVASDYVGQHPHVAGESQLDGELDIAPGNVVAVVEPPFISGTATPKIDAHCDSQGRPVEQGDQRTVYMWTWSKTQRIIYIGRNRRNTALHSRQDFVDMVVEAQLQE
jgi:hypothetical protein